MRICQNCGKGTVKGKSGVHRYGGGWARRAQKTSRIWKPNLHQAKLTIDGKTKTFLLCTKCLRRAKKETFRQGLGQAKEQKETKKESQPTLVPL